MGARRETYRSPQRLHVLACPAREPLFAAIGRDFPACESAWGLDADRDATVLIVKKWRRSEFDADSQYKEHATAKSLRRIWEKIE